MGRVPRRQVECTHNQRWEHWIPALSIPQIPSGKLVCGSNRDKLLFPDFNCACPKSCKCRIDTRT